ncbi:MAG: MATE family efflux transporter [Treponema sp.]|nr:MATE family efflux transporter [Treponema sp.]MCL2251907.1 MATE family efflux transporter [Treponema sp.]
MKFHHDGEKSAGFFSKHIKSRIGTWSFYRQALSIALPVMLQSFIMSMVSLVDNFMVAGLGDVSMAAVNVTNHLFFVFFVIINTICQAGGIYIAQFNGAKDSDGMKNAYSFKAIFAVSISILCFAVCRIFPFDLISILTVNNEAQTEIAAVGSSYLTLVSWAFIPTAISLSIATSFREIARPKIPLIISGIAAVINTIGNWILIYGNLGAPRLEVIGAGYATIIARTFEVIAFLIYAHHSKAPFFADIKRLFIIKKKLVAEIFAKSGMIFASEISWVASETLMIAMYNRRGGAEVVAGMAAGWTIANIFFLLFGGLWTASSILVGGALGAGKLDEARQRARWLKWGGIIGGIVLALPGFFLVSAIIPLVFYNLSAEARSNCFGLVSVILVYLPLWCFLNVQFAISRAGGDTAMGMYTDVSVNVLLFAPGAVLLSLFTNIAPVPMFAILKLTDIVKVFVARYLLKKEKWVKNLTEG